VSRKDATSQNTAKNCGALLAGADGQQLVRWQQEDSCMDATFPSLLLACKKTSLLNSELFAPARSSGNSSEIISC